MANLIIMLCFFIVQNNDNKYINQLMIISILFFAGLTQTPTTFFFLIFSLTLIYLNNKEMNFITLTLYASIFIILI